MNVARHMQRDALTALPTASIGTVRRLMDERGFGVLLIAADDGQFKGFVTRAALRAATDDSALTETIAHASETAVGPDDTLEKAALLMMEHRLVLLPVVDAAGKLVGVITQGEALRGLAAGLGIGLAATRMEVRLGKDGDDLYRVFDVLREHKAKLISLASVRETEAHRDVVLRLQGVADRESLRSALESALRDAQASRC
ncbi:MAG: CBS domain-containing protein [Candidatus Bipolaricaulota bacterium]